jgi:hypothetical protein
VIKNDNNRFSGVCSPYGEIYSYRRCLTLSFYSSGPYSPNGNSHLDHNASIDADFLKVVSFGVSRFAKKISGVIFAPKN